MKYGPDFIEIFLKELEKTPNIRYVCNKLGIDHSTFYRWKILYPSFGKRAQIAEFFGRLAMNSAAESVIISGIQGKDFKSSCYWLSHNEPRYMTREQSEQFGRVMDRDTDFLKTDIKTDGTNFESMFESLKTIEEQLGEGLDSNIAKLIIDLFCGNDSQLKEMFLSSYASWKKDDKIDDGQHDAILDYIRNKRS